MGRSGFRFVLRFTSKPILPPPAPNRDQASAKSPQKPQSLPAHRHRQSLPASRPAFYCQARQIHQLPSAAQSPWTAAARSARDPQAGDASRTALPLGARSHWPAERSPNALITQHPGATPAPPGFVSCLSLRCSMLDVRCSMFDVFLLPPPRLRVSFAPETPSNLASFASWRFNLPFLPDH